MLEDLKKLQHKTTGCVHLSNDCGFTLLCGAGGAFKIARQYNEVKSPAVKVNCKICLQLLENLIVYREYNACVAEIQEQAHEPFNENRHSNVQRAYSPAGLLIEPILVREAPLPCKVTHVA